MKKEIIFWGMSFCSLIYGIIPEQSLFYLNIVIVLLFILMLILVGTYGILFIQNSWTRKKSYQINIPEGQELANKLGLELSPQPFWEKDTKIKAMSWGDSKKSKKITFGKDFLASLTSEEKKFVIGHEFFHLYGHEYLYYLIVLGPILLTMFSIPTFLNVPQNVIMVGVLGTVIGGMCLCKRSFESIADINGASSVSKEIAISALKKAYLGKEKKSFFIHPSIEDRINNLEKHFNN